MKKTNDLITQISEETTITGTITVENDIRIAGTIKGGVKCSQDLVLHSGGNIEGDLEATTITIAGKIQGNVTAKDKVILEASAVLEGDIQAKVLRIEEGALFHGSCKTNSNSETAK
jgi:cytoskeletal protein CcmA (bactofilin family)